MSKPFKMKKKLHKVLFFCFLVLCLITKSYGQESNVSDLKEVDNLAKQMFVNLNNRDFDAILQVTHPKVFEILPKEDMKNIIKSMFEGTDEYSIDVPKIIPKYKLSEIYTIEKDTLKYAFVTYDMDFKMTFLNKEFDEETKKMMVSMMKVEGIDAEFLSNNSLTMIMKDTLTIILKDNYTNNQWVMINYDPNSPFIYQIMSSALIEKTKEYKQNLMLERKKNSEN